METQINVIRNCVKKEKMWQKESYKPVAVAVRLCSTPYVVTCNICVILFVADPDHAGGAYSAPPDHPSWI